MKDATYERFVKRWEEVLDIPPQRLGVFTPVYKYVVRHLKVMPWPWFALLSLAVVLGVYALVGPMITYFTSLLQKSF